MERTGEDGGWLAGLVSVFSGRGGRMTRGEDGNGIRGCGESCDRDFCDGVATVWRPGFLDPQDRDRMTDYHPFHPFLVFLEVRECGDGDPFIPL